MLEIQKYLTTHTLEQLEAEYHIGAKRHPKFPNLVMLKYSQINAPMGERIVQECRGIILDEAEDWSAVCRPYDKFFNLGEGHATPIDWSSAVVYEKLDGSLMTLYFYAGEWRVASSGMPDAGGPVGAGSTTFADLFWKTWNDLGYELPTDSSLCYMFELMTPHNRVVVPHASNRIVLHGARVVATGLEVSPCIAAASENWEVVSSFPLTTADECVSAAEKLPPMECEGYVVRDRLFNRVKIKSPKYVALAHAKDGFTVRRMIELVRTNEGDEFLSYFPELRSDFEKTKAAFVSLLNGIHAAYETIAGIEVQRDFATAALKTPYSPVLFAIRNKKVKTAQEFLASATIQAVERMMGIVNVESLESRP